jgi:hypothetical protein
MASETGIFYESVKYSARNGLPIKFIIEDNGMSVNSPTQETWGLGEGNLDNVIYYEYQRDAKLGHSGTGEFIIF